jgi:Uma2 family endonuclease
MNADEFIAWAMEQPRGRRYELVGGEVIAMAPEQLEHTEAKGAVYRALHEAIRAAGISCRAYTEGPTVRVDPTTAYQPDCLVRCGVPLDPTGVEIVDPIIVVEVASPSTQALDAGAKLDDDGSIETRIVGSGPLGLDPPGITVKVESFFED